MTEYLFKATNGNDATHGGTYTYRKGHWTRHYNPDTLEACRHGWHLARNEQVLDWLAPTLWLAEACPDHGHIDANDKVVTCKVRLVERLDSWNERTARLFAADCAEDALNLIDNPDPRSIEAIHMARLYANGDATPKQLTAAWDAAWDAAWAATGAATGAAARAATWAAAGDAARAAAGAAAAAAWAAARAATWAAAGDAARAATWAAAGAAAGAATWAATWAAARDVQYRRLLDYLELT